MKILIASGIFAPESGGPATYAPRLAAKLVEAGHQVTVVTFSSDEYFEGDETYPFKLIRVVRSGKLIDRIRFFRSAYALARTCDLIYTLDWFAAGLPVALAARLRKVPYIVRVGGDYLWEQKYLESGEGPMSLSDFYKNGLHRRASYRIFFWLIRYVLSRAARVVFNSDAQRILYERFYQLSSAKVSTIYNPVPKVETSSIRRNGVDPEFVLWGREIVMKNAETLVRAFAQARLPSAYRLTLIGDGPRSSHIRSLVDELGIADRVTMLGRMSQQDVLERVKNCRAFVLPSWTDISPNQVFEALAIGLPGLVTKENYLPIHDQLPDMIDPASADDIAQKLEMLADDARYQIFSKKFNSIRFDHDWDAVTQEHLALFEKVVRKSSAAFRVLQIGADRSRWGILHQASQAAQRQRAYANQFGQLDIIGFSRRSDDTHEYSEPHLHVYPTNSSSPFTYGIDAISIAKKLLRPDVVSVQDPFETGLAGWWIARMNGVPLHVQVHTDFLSPEYARLSPTNRLRVMIAGFVLRRAARIRVVSDRIKSSIEQIYHLNIPISVLPIFIDVEKFKNAQPLDDFTDERITKSRYKILLVSRSGLEKNIAGAIEAFKKAAPKDACLIILGDIDPNYLSASDRIFGMGRSDPERFYKSADLVLVPSHYEGYGLVIVEALAAGKPVLSTDVGVARESGAIVSSEKGFADDLKKWFANGPREGQLLNYPYKNFEEYVSAYCEDIKATLTRK